MIDIQLNNGSFLLLLIYGLIVFNDDGLFYSIKAILQ